MYDYPSAQDAFIAVLDELGKGNAWQSGLQLNDKDAEQPVADSGEKVDRENDAEASSEKAAAQSGRDVALLDDTFHAMRLSFYYTGGVADIANLLARQGDRHYAPRLYADLGELYLSKKRFRDGADTYVAFVESYPLSAYAPRFSVSRISAFAMGDFPNEVRAEKQAFAERYSVTGEYWQQAEEPSRQYVKGQLRVYINELAAYYHGLAQQKKSQLSASASLAARAEVVDLYRQAGNWYQAWIDSFPNEPDLANTWFLLGETRFESNDFRDAVAAYENAAYGYNSFTKANEAGYAALLSYDRVLSDIQRRQAMMQADLAVSQSLHEEYAKWQLSRIDSALLFAETFQSDPRRIPILAQTAETVYELKDFERTIDVADRLIAAVGDDHEWRLKGYLLKGHAYMDMQQFASAETAYEYALGAQQALLPTLMPSSREYLDLVDQYQQTLENYAASIYKQGELANAAGDPELAAQTFLRVVERAPDSQIRVTAQYDAAVLVMKTVQ
ncbi:tetratricopeptide repeat protein, partial [bacterium]|nr:tetratricopeptide repeat protein [bacterium]